MNWFKNIIIIMVVGISLILPSTAVSNTNNKIQSAQYFLNCQKQQQLELLSKYTYVPTINILLAKISCNKEKLKNY